MTNRERFQKTLHFNHSDGVPYFEEGIRKNVLRKWYSEGLPKTQNLSDLFHTDHFSEIQLNIDPIPEITTWPSSLKDTEQLQKHFNSQDFGRIPGIWNKIISETQKSDTVFFLRVHIGFFQSMGIQNWKRFNEVMSIMIENPDILIRSMNIHGKFLAEFFDKVLNEIKIDAAIFSEPIGGNEGPLISPEMYEKFALKNYMPLIDVLRNHGIKTIVLRTYANIRIYLPLLIKYGFNCLWACETYTVAMDYRDIRKEFGDKMGLIGGIDLDALRQGKEAIRKEIKTKIPQLLARGGYIPLADGRIRKDVKFENYLYYRNLLKEEIEKITSKS